MNSNFKDMQEERNETLPNKVQREREAIRRELAADQFVREVFLLLEEED